MMITLDAMAQRYHLLPSEVLERSSTFDLRVLDVGNAWNRHQYEKQTQQTQSPSTPNRSKKLTQEMMSSMIERAREKHAKRQHKN